MTFTITTPTTSNSVLIIGASRGLGLECLRQLAKHTSNPKLHAFCRDTSKIASSDKELCESIISGDARSPADLEKAMVKTQADLVIVSIGNGQDVRKTDIRQASAEALVGVLKKPDFQHVRVLVVSSNGAGASKIIVGMGIGKMISFHLRHVLKDHTKQEKAFTDDMSVRKRTTIVRPTALVNNKATGKLHQFEDTEKPPSIETDREDLAAWIVHDIFSNHAVGGKIVNITGVKQ